MTQTIIHRPTDIQSGKCKPSYEYCSGTKKENKDGSITANTAFGENSFERLLVVSFAVMLEK